MTGTTGGNSLDGGGVSLADPLVLAHGPALANRFMLAPLTNSQSNEDGTLGEDEYRWLIGRAKGGFGLTMTCAAHVQRSGKAFKGQLGIWSDDHLPGLTRLAQGIAEAGSVSAVQLHHGGLRASESDCGMVCPWDDAETGARALTTGEVEQVIEDFVLAALRAEKAGFQGVELHGAHNYLFGQFLESGNVRRTDQYGGSLENRQRMLFAVIDGIRGRCGADFQLGLRLSPERHGIPTAEARLTAERVMLSGKVDYLDMSLWDVFKRPVEPEFADHRLIDLFTGLPRGNCRLGVAGKITSAATARACLDAGADFVLIGRGAILHHDFPRRALADPGFESVPRPVSRDHLRAEGLSEPFIEYMTTFKDFVAA
ncbi:MAG: NADH:flavin oxidoreductase [Novosphingobium sp.]|nr:NADH:flavin oxidoreductase [Novosphingobium sp.]